MAWVAACSKVRPTVCTKRSASACCFYDEETQGTPLFLHGERWLAGVALLYVYIVFR